MPDPRRTLRTLLVVLILAAAGATMPVTADHDCEGGYAWTSTGVATRTAHDGDDPTDVHRVRVNRHPDEQGRLVFRVTIYDPGFPPQPVVDAFFRGFDDFENTCQHQPVVAEVPFHAEDTEDDVHFHLDGVQVQHAIPATGHFGNWTLRLVGPVGVA